MVEPDDVERNHDDYRELLGAYALGAVTPDERRAVAEHLAICDECTAELARLRVAVRALPLALADREPSPALRDRIQAAVRQDPADGRGQEGGRRASVLPGPRPPAAATRPPGRSTPRRLPVSPWAAAAVVLLAVSLGMLLWNLRLQQTVQRQGRIETVALQTTGPAAGASGQLTYVADRQVAILSVRDLPPLAPGQVYEVWLLPAEGAPVPAGVFAAPTARHAMAVDRGDYQGVAITVEPGPFGSPGPTTAPLAQAPLPRG